jgi:hypothetical protein
MIVSVLKIDNLLCYKIEFVVESLLIPFYSFEQKFFIVLIFNKILLFIKKWVISLCRKLNNPPLV